MSQSIPGKPVFPALPRLSSRGSTHTTVARGTALWESLLGMPRGKAPDPLIHGKGSVTLLLQFGIKGHLNAPNSRRGLTSLGRLQKYSNIHVSTGEESSRSGTDSTQGLRPRHRRERNPKRLPSNSHGDWPFLRPPERVPEVPVVSREHLPQLEKIQEVADITETHITHLKSDEYFGVAGATATSTSGSILDYCFTSKGDFYVHSYDVISGKQISGGNSFYTSDHYPIVTKLLIRSK